MKEFKITKGEWVKTERPTVNVDGVWMTSVINSNKETVHTVYGEIKETADANAQLIAEAGTVANETGMSPRQLLEQRNELLKYSKMLLEGTLNSHIKLHKVIESIEQQPTSKG